MPNASPNYVSNPILVELGQAIRRARLEREMSQEKLALVTEIDRAYVGAIERGEQNVGVMHLVHIAYAMEMTLTELVMEAAL